jgi:crotonobetainyl-CoA:carnitine CoA-transferase CaiB-like acyl-CoA transferase
MYKHYNRGKRGITLDLATDEGRAVLYKLVEKADVFLTSYLTETRKKLKFDVEDIRAVNPRIIYAKGTGRGPQGPLAERGGYDGATWWGRGSLQDTAMRAAGVSEPPGMTGHGDGMSGHTLAGGICAALVHRALTGNGVVVDGSLMGTATWFNGPAINGAASGQPWGGGGGPRAERNPLVNIYKTKDSRWLNFCMLSGDRDWHDLVKHLGRPELASDPRFAKAEERSKHHREAVAILDQVFAQRTLKEWTEILKTTLGVWEPVTTPADILEDVQTVANGFVRKAKYPDGSEVRLVVPGVLFNQDSGEPRPAPEWGQHTEQVLGELGMTSGQIAELRRQGVIR